MLAGTVNEGFDELEVPEVEGRSVEGLELD